MIAIQISYLPESREMRQGDARKAIFREACKILQIEERSYKRITIEDLKKLEDLALKERTEFFDRHPRYRKAYENSLIAIALCQGAASHFVDGKTGVKDFDIWYFYIQNSDVTYPYRALKSVDSNLSEFGVHPDDVEKRYRGRRGHLMGRTIDISIVKRNNGDAMNCIIEYLEAGRTTTARELAKKSVVGLWPDAILGRVIWSGR